MLRVARNVDILARLGEVDLFSLYDTTADTPVVPDHVRIKRLGLTPYPAPGSVVHSAVKSHLVNRLPWHVALRSRDGRPRDECRAFHQPPYDVVWISTAATWEWLGRPHFGPTIIDLIDLEDVKVLQQAALDRSAGGERAGALSARWREQVKTRFEAGTWRHLQKNAVRLAERVVVSSEIDAVRLGSPKAVVVPNTFTRPAQSVGSSAPGRPPTIVFPATFDYPPNAEGAQWLVREVAPRLATRVPGARICLAGRSTPEVEALAAPPAITVTGFVSSMEDQLAQADVVIVPLLRGSGTRLKILEAMAHRVPVVSTTIGAEGLDVADGVHLLVADTPDEMTRAVARYQDDPDLRARIVDAAEARFLDRYEDGVAEVRIRELVDELVPPPAPARW